jgi:hypothetical protein
LGLGIRVGDEPELLQIKGIDLHTTGGINGNTGDATGTLLLVDEHGELATASGALRVDLPRLVEHPEDAFTQLLETPLDVLIRVPERLTAELPKFVRPEDLAGTVTGTLQVKGTLQKPTLFLRATGSRLALRGDASEPVDLKVNAEYDPTTGKFDAQAAATADGKLVAQSRAHGSYLGEDALAWVGEARVDVTDLPFGLVGALAESNVAGGLRGHLSLKRTRTGSSASADLRVVNASVGGVPIGTGRATLETSGARARAAARLATKEGSLEVDGEGALHWGAFLPSLDPGERISGRISAKQYTAAVLAPLIGDSFERVSGRVDAALRFDLRRDGGSDEQPRWQGGLTGAASIQDGSALVVPLGLELDDIELSATANSKDGTTHVAVRGARAKARHSKDNVFASADLFLAGPTLQRGSASLETVEVPLVFQGVSQGRATGRATAKMTREESYMRADVRIHELSVRLPASSSRAVIDLDENEAIRVIQLAKEERPDDDVLAWQLLVDLGDDVRIRRSEIDIGVTGTPVVELGVRTDVFGTMALTPGGRVPILGKVFVVQHGNLYFDTGDPSNPRVDVTAEWRSPEGTVVYVDVAGTLSEAKVALRSDPPLPEPQVFAILLGGSSSPDSFAESEGTESDGGAARAVGISSGVAALGLNELLGNSPVEIRVGTTSESRTRYTAAVRIGENLWFEASTYQTSSTEIGGTDKSVFSGTVDYRFTRNWSLRTELGTAGGALDLLWQYRY